MTIAEYILETPLKSLNKAYGNATKGRKKTEDFKRYQTAICWELKICKQPPVTGPYSVAVQVPLKTRSDIDNLLKGVLDCLVKIKATPDDRKLVAVSICKSSVKNTLILVSDEDLDLHL
tara:strand:+ start:14726 stop:15082 length:357 start_codon:yes stop_codon:yes gene_type:complete